VSDKFEFIEAECAAGNPANNEGAPPIVKMCAWLDVSRSGFYGWRDQPLLATAERLEELKLYITRSFADSDGTYGYRRVHADLVEWGVPCGPELVRALMRELGLEPCQPRPWRHRLTEQDGQAGPIPDLVNRDFTADAPGHKMVGRHYPHPDLKRMGLFGHGHRLPHQGRRRVGDGR
jgi:transposase InsO family protein